MRKIIFSLLLIFYYLFFMSLRAHAADATPSANISPTQKTINAVIEQQINGLRERIASRVAQLKLVEKRGVIGTVSEIAATQITVSDTQNNTRIIDVDELTKFSSPSAKENFGISDLNKGMLIGILGIYNKESRKVLARFINTVALPVRAEGTIASIDSKNYNLNIVTDNNKPLLIDIENITKIYLYTKGVGLAKVGFSKITQNERIFCTGTFDVKDKTRFIPTRLIMFPDVANNPIIDLPKSPSASVSATPNPATTSAKIK